MLKKIYLTTAVLLLAGLFISLMHTASVSYPSGRTGCTKKTTTAGCNCHSYGTTVNGAITGSDSVLAGSTVTFTLTITCTGGSGALGCDIAAKNGTLAVISGSGLKLLNGELTHSSAISYVSPKVINFSYTAPGSAGSDTLYATVDRGYSGAWNWAPNKGFKIYTVSGIVNNETPVSFYLNQNFPNPFNPVTKITYGIAKASNVKVSVYDMTGRQVASLVNEYQNAGNYFVNFDASKYSSGIYYYKIEAGDFREVKKMSLIK